MTRAHVRILLVGMLAGLGGPLASFTCERSAVAAEKPIVVVVLAEEKESRKIAILLTKGSLDGVTLREGGDVVKALHAAGLEGTVQKAAATEKGRAALFEKMKTVGAASGVDAMVVIRVAVDKKGRDVTYEIVDCHGGVSPSHVVTRVGHAPSKKDDVALLAAIDGPLHAIAVSLKAPPVAAASSSNGAPEGDAVAGASEGPEPPSVDDLLGTHGDGSDVGDVGSAPSKKGRVHDEIVALAVGAEMASRRFVYQNPGTTNLRPYDLPSAPGVTMALDLTPFSHTPVKLLQGLGVFADYHMTVATTSQVEGGSDVKTKWARLDAGARWLVALGKSGVALGPVGAFSRDDFRLEDASSPDLPSVTYRSIRLGGLVRATLASVELRLGAAWVHPLSATPLTTRFRHSSVTGVELEASVAAPLGSHLELSLGVAFTRFSWTFRSEPGDAYVATSASDELARAVLALAFRL